ncbi:unnamed protein product [Rotaria magnacalcarata]|uniref:Uncharacterized protein n=1 Tax=Rotaria magnacalcarata TaxID=392030 RepID=A0A8S3HBX9_9BILA|nr:unnamed protein product [Rotaria magnacalcarata]
MNQSNDRCNLFHGSDLLLQEGQHDTVEVISPTQIHSEESTDIDNKKPKCHGNKKLQRFKRKWRTRGFNEEEIATLINIRSHDTSEQSLNESMMNDEIETFNKRKRSSSKQKLSNKSLTSMSQSSISQGVFKKMKNGQIETKSPIDNNSDRLNENDDISFYKPSRYLKMPRKFLLNSLRLQLNCSIKRKKEQRFTLSRLELFDKQFCLHQIHHLYQKYLDFGLQYQIWPDDIVQIMESNESDKIQKSLEEYLILLKNRSNQHENELMIQLSSCPTTLHPLELIDQRLKEFVRLHHIDLVRTANYQKHKLKDIIYEKRLFNQLSSYHLAEVQVRITHRIFPIIVLCCLAPSNRSDHHYPQEAAKDFRRFDYIRTTNLMSFVTKNI